MKFPREYRLEELAQILGREFVGPADHKVAGINEIHRVVPGDLVFVDNEKYYDKALRSAADTVLIDKPVPQDQIPKGKALLVSPSPFDDFLRLLEHFSPHIPLPWKDAQVAEDVQIGAGAVIGEGVSIGSGSRIGPGVVIYPGCTIGKNVIIHANSVIGADAFYYKKHDDHYYKLHSVGSVVIADDVEIGALSSIDRGVTATTEIGAGSKLDNQVHVGHDTIIGKNCLIAAQVGIAGCCVLEDHVTLWGQVGIPADIHVGKGATVLGQSGLSKSVEGGKVYFGSPAGEARLKFREQAAIRRLPEIIESL